MAHLKGVTCDRGKYSLFTGCEKGSCESASCLTSSSTSVIVCTLIFEERVCQQRIEEKKERRGDEPRPRRRRWRQDQEPKETMRHRNSNWWCRSATKNDMRRQRKRQTKRENMRKRQTDERGRGCSMFQKSVCLSFPHVRMRSGSKGLHDADVMPPECPVNVFFLMPESVKGEKD